MNLIPAAALDLTRRRFFGRCGQTMSGAVGTTALTVTSGTPVLSNFVTGSLFVFVGGRVQPGAVQAQGAYTGTIVLAAAYTGL